MKKTCTIIIALFAGLGIVSAQEVIGKWKLDDGSAIVEVYKSGDSYNGKIVWLKDATMPDGSPVCDLNNPDKSLRSRKLMGLNMLSGLKKIDFEDMCQLVPVALMLISMPISSSIGHGIGLGMISYTVIKVFTGKAKEVSVLTYIISALFLIKFFLVV